MAEPIDVFYWDACLFYEYLNNENVRGSQRLALEEILSDNRARRNRICTSVFTHIEVLPAKLTPGAETRYWAQFGSLYFFDIEADRSVLLLSREIKDFYFREKSDTEPARMMSSGDSIQIATAIIHEVTAFHTRDNKRKGGNVPLLGLKKLTQSELICDKYDLRIESPDAKQGDIEYF